MTNCKYIIKNGRCGLIGITDFQHRCFGEDMCRFREPMTNADKIRSMRDEELAKHLVDIGWDCHLCAEHRRLDNEPLMRVEKCDEECVEHCLEWLRQPVKED